MNELNIFKERIENLVAHWDKMPSSEKKEFRSGRYDDTIRLTDKEENICVFILDRQKPNTESDYYFDEERIGFTKEGKIIYGFDSGCSCPVPWGDGEECYEEIKTWKEFQINLIKLNEEDKTSFDKTDLYEDLNKRITELENLIK